MTKSESRRIVALLQGAYPHRPLPDTTADVYALGLGDLDYETAAAAVVRIVRRSKWLPTIAEIRSEIVEDRIDLPAPEVAWGLVLRAISRFGSYRLPEFDHSEVKAAVDVIGWQAICLDENVAATRARWIDAYRSLRERRIELEVTGRYVAPNRQLECADAVQLNAEIGKLLEGRFPSRRGKKPQGDP